MPVICEVYKVTRTGDKLFASNEEGDTVVEVAGGPGARAGHFYADAVHLEGELKSVTVLFDRPAKVVGWGREV